ncbi:hypothetical protein K438DRAFT_2030112, partial [Mycena galopus ATCC 62051]
MLQLASHHSLHAWLFCYFVALMSAFPIRPRCMELSFLLVSPTRTRSMACPSFRFILFVFAQLSDHLAHVRCSPLQMFVSHSIGATGLSRLRSSLTLPRVPLAHSHQIGVDAPLDSSYLHTWHLYIRILLSFPLLISPDYVTRSSSYFDTPAFTSLPSFPLSLLLCSIQSA